MDGRTGLADRLKALPVGVQAGLSGALAAVFVVAVVLLIVGGSGSGSDNAAAPQAAPQQPGEPSVKAEAAYEQTAAEVKSVFKKLAETSRPGLGNMRLLAVDCADGKCRVEFDSDGPGGGKVIQDLKPVYKAVFKNSAIEEASFVAYTQAGADQPLGGKATGADPAVTLTCNREAMKVLRNIDANSAGKIKNTCKYKSPELPGE